MADRKDPRFTPLRGIQGDDVTLLKPGAVIGTYGVSKVMVDVPDLLRSSAKGEQVHMVFVHGIAPQIERRIDSDGLIPSHCVEIHIFEAYFRQIEAILNGTIWGDTGGVLHSIEAFFLHHRHEFSINEKACRIIMNHGVSDTKDSQIPLLLLCKTFDHLELEHEG